MAHRIRSFNDDTYDTHYVVISYDDDQDYPSPLLMVDYENKDQLSNAQFFLQHPNMTSAEASCHKGARIRSYSKKFCLGKWLEQVSRVFNPDDLQMSEVTPILTIPKELNINNVQEVSSLCGSPSVRKFLHQAKSFQRDAVKKWNPEADEPTQSNHAGLVAMNEAASNECGALALVIF